MIRDRLISIERMTAGVANAFNEPTEAWVEICKAWASRKDISDRDKSSAGMMFSARVARFVVLSNTDTRSVTTEDRINGEGGIWRILGVKEIDRNRRVEITAEMRSD